MIYESSKRLASALRDAGLEELAKKAETNFYNDFFGESATPMIDLDADLAIAFRDGKMVQRVYLKLRSRIRSGDFDGTVEEGELWAKQQGHYETH